MIDATLIRSNNIYSIDVSGHAEYAPKGADIVCAAVSALVQSFEFYCMKAEDVRVLEDERKEGVIRYIVVGDKAKIDPAFEMMKTGIREISLNFPKNISYRGEK